MFKWFAFLLCLLLLSVQMAVSDRFKYIEDFTGNSSIDDWYEISDTRRTVGKSKATFVIQETKVFRRAIFFALLNPQPCGAAFAGMSKRMPLDLSPYNTIMLKARGQGEFFGYKFILRQPNEKSHFCNFFDVTKEFSEITLNIDEFKPYFEGKLVNDSSIVLKKDEINSIGLQAYGGVYLSRKQSGVGSLEIDWIRVG